MNEPRTSAAFSFMTPALLAFRADAEKFQFVTDGLELVFGGNAPLNFRRKAFVNLDDFRTLRAYQMVVMAVVALTDQLEPRCAVAEIKPLDHAHFFEQVHGPVNRRQITQAPGQPGKNLTAGERMRVRAQNIQDRLARAGDFVRLSAQTTGERGQFLPLVRVGMFVRVRHH
jgi:hypothetical protein